MASSKSTRQPPSRRLEQYVASIKRAKNNFDFELLPDFRFDNFVSPGSDITGTAISNISIGFDFKVNDITYKSIYINDYGYAVLQDSSGFSPTDVSTNTNNISILSSFLGNHVILAPWWDISYVPTSTIDYLAASGHFNLTLTSVQQLEDIKQGKDTNPWPFDRVDRGTRYANYYDSLNGKAFVIRWTLYTGSKTVSISTGSLFKLKFELTLFENGKIEFRYWPLDYYTAGDSTNFGTRSSTVGIFWSGPDFGSNKFRDFATLIDYNKNSRSLNDLGGAGYDVSYVETSKPYSNQINLDYWPGPGVITFDPPKNLGKFLPRKVSQLLSSTKHLTPRLGLFDDRKTFNFRSGSVSIEMPSTLPSRLIGNTSSDINVGIRQLMFTNHNPTGSIRTTGGINKSVIDSQLEILDALEDVAKNNRNSSFNEARQNFLVTQTTSSFYTNENSLELFGDGFTSPLKSKTKFIVNLPITKPVKMPETTSSFYWYNKQRSSWDMSGVASKIENTYVDYNGLTDGTGVYTGERNDKGYYRIAESAIGFDAVGRKIVSGTFDIDPGAMADTITSQGTLGIGVVLNCISNEAAYLPYPNYLLDNGKNSASNFISKIMDQTPIFGNTGDKLSFDNSIPDSGNNKSPNPNFFPSADQQFSIGNEYPFLIEKIVVSMPIKASGSWFKDVTTCNKPFSLDDSPSWGSPVFAGYSSGPIDFGGPALTFAIHSPKNGQKKYLDLIASGTITHNFDNSNGFTVKKDPNMNYYCMRPTGFKSFSSNPTFVINGVWNGSEYTYEGDVNLEMSPSIAGGVTITRNTVPGGEDNQSISLLLSSSFLDPFGSSLYGKGGPLPDAYYEVDWSANTDLRIYLQQVSPLSRGSSKLEFNGSSILGSNIAYFNIDSQVKNPFYLTQSNPEVDSALNDNIVKVDKKIETICIYSLVDTKESPYLILPGEKLSVSISKTKPVVYNMKYVSDSIEGDPGLYVFGDYSLTGSHDGVLLNTGSINITFYGSYVKEGSEYHL